jgi:hypothetical protein
MPFVFTTTTATYTLNVTQVMTVEHGTWTNVISHVHWNLSAEDQNGNRARSGGVLPFQLGDINYTDKLSGNTVEHPGVFDPTSFVPYEDVSEDIALSWAQQDPIFNDVVNSLEARLKSMPTNIKKQVVPWSTATT